jgi:membrane-associated phospholipid phosphatase
MGGSEPQRGEQMTDWTNRPLPAERLLTFYNILMVVLWAAMLGRAWYALWLGLAHVAALPLPWLFSRLPHNAGRGMRFLRELSPLLLVGVFWIELDLVRPALDLVGIDKPVAALDRLVFGVHLHEVWLPAMDAVWFSELMHLAYWAYYPAAYLPPIILAVMARNPATRDMVFRLTLVYLSCYLVYIAFPVDGPHFLEEPTVGIHQEGFFYGLVESAQRMGDSLGCSFPSSHVAIAVTAALLAWRWLPRWIAVLLWIEAVGVLLSTTYTQHHYAIDSLVGLLWAFGFWWLATPVHRRLGGEPPPAPTASG